MSTNILIARKSGPVSELCMKHSALYEIDILHGGVGQLIVRLVIPALLRLINCVAGVAPMNCPTVLIRLNWSTADA